MIHKQFEELGAEQARELGVSHEVYRHEMRMEIAAEKAAQDEVLRGLEGGLR